MGRLKALAGPLNVLPPRIARSTDDQGHGQAIDPWRRWYQTKRWKRLKQAVHMRDGWVCQQEGCGRLIVKTIEAICHHIIAHRGAPELFWDINNCQTVCKGCHDGPIQKAEAKARSMGEL